MSSPNQKHSPTLNPAFAFHGPAHDTLWFYSMLLAGGMSPDSERIVSEKTVASLTTRQHEGLRDETFGVVMDRGLPGY